MYIKNNMLFDHTKEMHTYDMCIKLNKNKNKKKKLNLQAILRAQVYVRKCWKLTFTSSSRCTPGSPGWVSMLPNCHA